MLDFARLPQTERDLYQQRQEMFTKPPPSFEDILDQLGKIERAINRK